MLEVPSQGSIDVVSELLAWMILLSFNAIYMGLKVRF